MASCGARTFPCWGHSRLHNCCCDQFEVPVRNKKSIIMNIKIANIKDQSVRQNYTQRRKIVKMVLEAPKRVFAVGLRDLIRLSVAASHLRCISLWCKDSNRKKKKIHSLFLPYRQEGLRVAFLETARGSPHRSVRLPAVCRCLRESPFLLVWLPCWWGDDIPDFPDFIVLYLNVDHLLLDTM